MTKLNPVAVTSANLLRVIAQDSTWMTKADLVTCAGRDPKNASRDLSIVETAGLIAVDPALPPREGIVLTDEGKAQLAAIGRAEHGGQARRPRERCLIERIIPNPANRKVETRAVEALADTIEAVGDVLEAVQLTPPDANGMRMLLDGEHRWKATTLLKTRGRLPEALTGGLLFHEREATPAEQILIRIVTASARAPLTALEDARQLLALQEETGWSGREIAKKTGRSPADSDRGVRDVQVKLKIAREATPQALAAYALTGSWDDLVASIATARPSTPPTSSVPLPSPWQPSPPSTLTGQGAEEPEPELFPAPRIEWILDSVLQSPAMAMGQPARPMIEIRAFRAGPETWCAMRDWRGTDEVLNTETPEPGIRTWPSRADAIFDAVERTYVAAGPNIAQTLAEWLDSQAGPLVVKGVRCPNASRAQERRFALGWDKRQSNSGGGARKPEGDAAATEASDTPTPQAETPAQPQRIQGDLDRDPWDRTSDQITADEALLKSVQDSVATGFVAGGLADLESFRSLGIGSATVDSDGWVNLCDPDGLTLTTLTIDEHDDLPDKRVRALEILVTRAINRVMGGQ
ncbi:MAG: hypothetical protein DCF29_03750 [Alphaproteobacteria bacterium]|nr:MAG: hypothetical protein DCF29_03750 [Alphaproteobacteria bacterium]